MAAERRRCAGAVLRKAGEYLRLAIPSPQLVQPKKACAARRLDRRMGHLGIPFDLIAHFHQLSPKRTHGVGVGDGGVYVRTGQPPEIGLPRLFCLPLGTADSWLTGFDDGQTILQTDRVRCAPDTHPRAAQQIRDTVTVHGTVHKGHAVEYDSPASHGSP